MAMPQVMVVLAQAAHAQLMPREIVVVVILVLPMAVFGLLRTTDILWWRNLSRSDGAIHRRSGLQFRSVRRALLPEGLLCPCSLGSAVCASHRAIPLAPLQLPRALPTLWLLKPFEDTGFARTVEPIPLALVLVELVRRLRFSALGASFHASPNLSATHHTRGRGEGLALALLRLCRGLRRSSESPSPATRPGTRISGATTCCASVRTRSTKVVRRKP